jgi:hypothetical protein
MTTSIQTEHFTKAIYLLLEETFDNVRGIYLDKGTSMFETLAGISAEEATIPVGGKCATLAAQVKHVAFYLDVLDKSQCAIPITVLKDLPKCSHLGKSFRTVFQREEQLAVNCLALLQIGQLGYGR